VGGIAAVRFFTTALASLSSRRHVIVTDAESRWLDFADFAQNTTKSYGKDDAIDSATAEKWPWGGRVCSGTLAEFDFLPL
jgi:hypothetical protein